MLKPSRKKEEFWNVLTHGIGALFSILALVAMLTYSIIDGSRMAIACSVVFGSSLVLLYSASTVYHAMSKLRYKRIFQKVDHLCIYLLIAGTYTPVALLGLRGTWGWVLFGLSWAMVILGFIFKFSPLRRSEKLSLSLYGIMGWLLLVAIKPFLENVAPGGVALILAGGLCYTFGIYFYASKKIRYNHAIWHVFVLGGSTLHFLGIFLYLIP